MKKGAGAMTVMPPQSKHFVSDIYESHSLGALHNNA